MRITSSSSSDDSSAERTSPFGLWTLVFLVIANMVGAGVFTTSGFALADLGSSHRVMLAWLIGGVIALTGAWSYGQLARAIPESGGEYLFLSRIAHPLVGFIAGWVSLIAGFTGAIAFAATALESYLVPGNLKPDWLPRDAVAVGVVVLGGIIHGLKARGGAFLQNAAVMLKLLLLVALIALAFVELPSQGSWGKPAPDPALTGWPLIAALATSLVWISLSYSGFNAAVYVAGEARDASRSVPKALAIGTVIVVLLYLLLNAVFVYGPPPERIIGVADVAAVAADWVAGPRAATVVRLVIALALLTSVLSMIMAAPRVYAKMADDGLMPRRLRFQGSTPRFAVAAQVLLAVIFILASTLRDLLSYLGLTLSLCAALSVACLFLLHRRAPSPVRPTRLTLITAGFYVLATLTTATVMAINDPARIVATLVTFLVGAVIYSRVRKAPRSPS